MDLGLREQVALVTGGSKGLGYAIAEELLREGAVVAICARHTEELAAAVRGLEPSRSVHAVPADVTLEEDACRLIESVRARYGRLDILVNNAGGAVPGSFAQLTDGDWQRDFEVKVLATIRLCRLALADMRPRGYGRIVNIGATMGRAADPRFFASCTLRAACLSLSKNLAVEAAPAGVTVNSVNIGFVETPQWHTIHERQAPEEPYDRFLARVGREQVPLGRLGRPDEVAGIVAFLASRRAGYITGASIDVSGGQGPYV